MSVSHIAVSTDPIGVFDSGVGGLSVLDVLVNALPHERFVYLGDTAHMPYGERSPEDIAELATGIVQYLHQAHRVKMVVVACNTSAGVLAEYWQQGCPVPAIEPVTPMGDWLATQPYKKIGLMATQTTVNSGRYPAYLNTLNPSVAMQAVACTGLAKLVEEHQIDTLAGRALVYSFLVPLVEWGMDALILGCTHYPFATAVIDSCLRELSSDHAVAILDPAQWMGERVKHVLTQRQLLNQKSLQKNRAEQSVQFLVTGDPSAFDQTAQNLNLASVHVQPSVLVNCPLRNEPSKTLLR